MLVANKNMDCKPCQKTQGQPAKKDLISFLGSLFLIVLPKCPFCFMAFSSTMLLCGEGVTMTSERIFHSTPTILLSGLFCGVAIAGILMVRRDIRTFYALLLALTGTVLVMTSVLKAGGMPLYYTGTFIIFLGVWLNTSLLYIIRKLGFYTGKQLAKAPVQ
jgi:hypothetical protein